jgi:hypothetical protein
VSFCRVEFPAFSGPLDEDVEARVYGEYLWGRHFVFFWGRFLGRPEPPPSLVRLRVCLLTPLILCKRYRLSFPAFHPMHHKSLNGIAVTSEESGSLTSPG